MPSLISINDLSTEQIMTLCQRATTIHTTGFQHTLSNKIIAPLFFEASTRTKMSFKAAALRANATVLSSFSSEQSSLKKGESFEDTIRMMGSYADIVIVRHPQEGFARRASEIISKPVINAGDGTNEHPSQTLLDLYTIYQHHPTLSDFTICLAGDLKHSRTVHSLVYALARFNCKIILCSPKELALPEDLKKIIQQQILLESNQLKEGLSGDYIYMTRVQKERFKDSSFQYEDDWVLNLALCQQHASPNLKIMHPLPRINEIHTDLDDSPYAIYFQQAENGIYSRIALLEYCLGVEL